MARLSTSLRRLRRRSTLSPSVRRDGPTARTRRIVALALTTFLVPAIPAADSPPRLKRADSFLGIHFDFHGGPNDKGVGQNTTPEMINRIIDLVRPDYLQIDCKGHPGYSSYPTKVGTPIPDIVGDPLRTWRDVTAARGVALYMHYSGVYDSHAVKNPGWAALSADGKPSDKATSLWGPYQQQLLIPQLKELAGDYGVDGVWVDGECWAAVVDYSPAALTAFKTSSGFDTVPRKPGEPHWFEFLEFQRAAFRDYLRGYITAVNRAYPKFQICSNWAFTDHMPEAVSAPVAFLSGDYAPDNSVNSARLSARFLAHQGRAWDLMAWSFSRKAAETPGGKVQKSALQLQREAAIVLALGGGFQAYYKQKRDGSIFDAEMTTMADVAAFCRARQALSHHAQSVPQVAVLLSREDQYRRNNGLFSRNLARVQGTLEALVESQYSVDVLGEHQLTGHCADYPLIVVPECDALEPKFRDELAAYARNGGSLLLVGPGSAKLFAPELGLTLTEPMTPTAVLALRAPSGSATLNGRSQVPQLPPAAQPFGTLTITRAPAKDGAVAAPVEQPAASISNVGRGRVAAVYFTAGQIYVKDHPAELRDFLAALAHELFPKPLVTVRGNHEVDVMVARNRGLLLVHLVNTSGPHATQPILDHLTPLAPITVDIRVAKVPAAVTLEPGARPASFTYGDGELHVSVPSVAIHDIVAIQER